MSGISSKSFMTDQSTTVSGRRDLAASILLWVCVPFMLVLPLWIFAKGLEDAQRQHWMIRTFTRVDAAVVSAQVTSFKGAKGAVHYVANVSYKYSVEGKTYQSDKLAPLSMWGSEEWANAVVAKYKASPACHAYYNPQDPGEAILMRPYIFEPYFEMLESTFMLTGGCFVILSMAAAKRREPVPSNNGWFEILPQSSERQRLLVAKICTGVWYGFGLVPALHYFICVPPPHTGRAFAFFEGFGLLGLIPLGMLIRYMRINLNLEDARLSVSSRTAILGQPFHFRIVQNARHQLQIRRVQARIVCTAGKDKARRVLFEATPVKLENRTLHSGETLDLPADVPIPADQPPSGRDATGKFDRITWTLHFECKADRVPAYNVQFLLTVEKPSDNEGYVEPDEKPRDIVDVRKIEPEYAGRILTKSNIAMVYLLAFPVLFLQLLGMGMMAAVFVTVFPDNAGSHPFIDLPKPQADLVFAAGAALTVIFSVYGLMFPSLLSGSYLLSVAKRQVERRRDAIVHPGPDSVYVDIIPRRNWNRLMLENATDIGFLTVDTARREIRFEGDRERYRIPADSLLSCRLEKSFYTSTARPNAPGLWLVVIRAAGPGAAWEAPVIPRLYKRRNSTMVRLKAAEGLLNKIRAIAPKAAQEQAERATTP